MLSTIYNYVNKLTGTNFSNNAYVVACIPAYNESKTISAIVHTTKKYVSEVIVYDDGSVDNTSELAKSAGATVIRSPFNRGYGVAIKSLFQAAREKNADVMITLDSDGQHDPAQIPAVLEPILEDKIDIVVGSRFLNSADKQKVPMYRSFGIKTITKLTSTGSFSNLTDAQSGFRAFSKRALWNINLFEEGMAVSTEILLRAKEKNLLIKDVPVTVRYDVANPSTHSPIAQGITTVNSIIQFISLRHPLAFYVLPGLILLAIAAVFMYSAVDLYSSTKYISTNMILVSVGASIVGVVLLATGIILNTLIALLKSRGI
jgi:glycosyltransferase involved in cell wall biosynthesis